MTRATAFRGQPLLVLTVLLVGWIAVRAALWQSPFAVSELSAGVAASARGALRLADQYRNPFVRDLLPAADGANRFQTSAAVLMTRGIAIPVHDLEPRSASHAVGSNASPAKAAAPLSRATGLSRTDASHGSLARLVAPRAAPFPARLRPRRSRAGSRWSADAWLLLREGGADANLASRPSYGRSQAGGVVRYDLAAASPLRPQVYLRGSAALAGAGDREAAVGISARPLERLPVRLAVEGRVAEGPDGVRIRPAAYAVTEVPRLRIPLGMSAEVYAQAGYVGGDFATAFADGQARIDRAVFQRDDIEIGAGIGVWGGAQKNASRLDIGPTAELSFRVRGTRARVEAGYRFRVAGAAAPASGPALTLSAGF